MSNSSAGVDFDGVEVDVLGEVATTPLAILVCYTGRVTPSALTKPATEKSGVMVIEVYAGLTTNTGLSAQESLVRYLSDETSGKSWIYHPKMTDPLGAHPR